jgi:hypothetical protein
MRTKKAKKTGINPVKFSRICASNASVMELVTTLAPLAGRLPLRFTGAANLISSKWQTKAVKHKRTYLETSEEMIERPALLGILNEPRTFIGFHIFLFDSGEDGINLIVIQARSFTKKV